MQLTAPIRERWHAFNVQDGTDWDCGHGLQQPKQLQLALPTACMYLFGHTLSVQRSTSSRVERSRERSRIGARLLADFICTSASLSGWSSSL